MLTIGKLTYFDENILANQNITAKQIDMVKIFESQKLSDINLKIMK